MQIEAMAHEAGLERVLVQWIGDPTYLAFGGLLFRVACLLERITPARMRVHLVAEYRRP